MLKCLVLKNEKKLLNHFYSKKNLTYIISKFDADFSENFFEVLHISVGQKVKILENHPDSPVLIGLSSVIIKSSN